ncbi:MAG: zinc dependent phospholipase C family protein [Planctomycetes bacterium]|nr:zinc dependent phospholipase C family protein [Planctomycetota bacterium]
MSLVLGLVLVVCSAFAALAAWGPGNHLEFEARVFRRRRELLPARIADLIEHERPAWQYGHIAADIINFKAFGGHYNHCHRWTIVDEMLALARSRAEEAFVLGYLSHLAADTIAHNHFVPYHLARYARGQKLGHLYWEMNADRFVDDDRWGAITVLKWDHRLAKLDELVNSTVPKKALSMGTNKLIFNHVLLSSERKLWRRNIERLHPRAHLRLERRFLDLFQRAAVERIALALTKEGRRKLAHVDTNGKAAQELALTLHNAIVERSAGGERRDTALERAASVFLEGMQSPPPKPDGGRKAHWSA